MAEKKQDVQIVGNIGMYYVCYRLSELGWNVMPTARNARGIDVIAYSPDGKRYLGIQIKTLSKRNPIPVGSNLSKVMGDFWFVVVRQKSGDPNVYVMTPEEVRAVAHKSGANHWIEPPKYDCEKFLNKWDRIGSI